MSGPDTIRLARESRDLGKDWDVSGVHAEPAVGPGGSANLLQWSARIKGPEGTPYEGGVFHVDIRIPPAYPFEPPKMKFTTQLWHPNVSSQTGAICLDILKDAWSPALTLKTALLSLQALLSSPEPKDPQDAEVASQYLKDRATWTKTARFWTESYALPKPAPSAAAAGGAGGPGGGAGGAGGADEGSIGTLVDMGFARDASIRALKAKGGDVQKAIEMLFSS